MSSTPRTDAGPLRFGVFEIDPGGGELRRNGSVVRLPPQPFQVLLLLVQNAGEVVDRDRIRREVWGDTVVDFDRSLNVCIAQVRGALNDDAESPRFIQTLPRRGYRFLAGVERPPNKPDQTASIPVSPRKPKRRRLSMALASAAAITAISVAAFWMMRAPPAPAVRVAVLPFDTVAVDESNAQLEGLFDELLTRLGGIQPDRMRVIGRRSVSRFRQERQSLRQIGERLQADYLVEGTVRAGQPHARVTMRLIESASESVLWSESFEQAGAGPEFEERFVAQVSAGVLKKLFPEASAMTAASGCPQGWDAYRTGRLFANRGTIADLRKSIGYFEQAGCSPAQAGLSQVWVRLAGMGVERADSWERARAAAKRALASDGGSATARLSLGNVALWKDWDWATADREFRAALQSNPSDPDAHHDQAWLLVATGRRREAIGALERSIALDPLSARTQVHAGWLLLQAGRFREAATQAGRALELEPAMAEARACLSRALLYAGDDQGALEAILPLIPEDRRAVISGKSPGEAIRLLFSESTEQNGQVDPYQRAWRLAWVGSRDEALSELERALQVKSSMMPLVAVDPAFAALRNHPRFQRVVRGVGL